METMSVLEPFEEYEGETRIRHEKGEVLTVKSERADQLRERGLARKKPASRKVAGDDADDENAENHGADPSAPQGDTPIDPGTAK